MKHPHASTLLISLGLLAAPLACSDDTTGDAETGTGTETGDGDGDPATATDTEGDGDGDATDTGDGDGDPTDTGDGDGDATDTGDGDGDTGDGDGDTTDTGDGDGDPTDTGDGDGDPTDTDTGDGDGDPMPADDTIYQCQDGTIALDSPVDVDGVWVTAIRGNGFFAQEEPGGENSGIWVFVGDMGPDISGLAIGDLVDVEGTLILFGDAIEEIDASMGSVMEVGVLDPIPDPDLVTGDMLSALNGEPWESVYVRIEGAPLNVTAPPMFDEFVVEDENGETTIIDNYIYNLPADGAVDFPNFGAGASFTAIQGPVNFSFDNFKIAPRFPADLEGYVEAPPPPGVTVNDIGPGDIWVTEFMFDPAVCGDNVCEWFEIFNNSGDELNLNGLIIRDEVNNEGTIGVDVFVADGDYAVLAIGTENNWGYMNFQPDAFYGANPALNNGGDLVRLFNDNEMLDETAIYPDYGAGISTQLDLNTNDAMSNDDPANYCPGTDVIEGGDLGTPGAANNPCP